MTEPTSSSLIAFRLRLFSFAVLSAVLWDLLLRGVRAVLSYQPFAPFEVASMRAFGRNLIATLLACLRVTRLTWPRATHFIWSMRQCFVLAMTLVFESELVDMMRDAGDRCWKNVLVEVEHSRNAALVLLFLLCQQTMLPSMDLSLFQSWQPLNP